MSTSEKRIRPCMVNRAIANELDKIAKASKLVGVSLSHLYEIQHTYETFDRGIDAQDPLKAPDAEPYPKRTQAVDSDDN